MLCLKKLVPIVGMFGLVLFAGLAGLTGRVDAEILTLDGDFNAQTVGENIGSPWSASAWGGASPATATTTAQSPFTNLFANNAIGANVPPPPATGGGYAYFIKLFSPAIPANSIDLLYLNADFRNNSSEAGAYSLTISKNASGSFRTAALYISGDTLYARSASGLGASILDPEEDVWYNVQLTLDMAANMYSGVITKDGGGTTLISSRSFATENDINCIYTDGHAGDHDIDNFALSITRVPEPGTIVLLASSVLVLLPCALRRRRKR